MRTNSASVGQLRGVIPQTKLLRQVQYVQMQTGPQTFTSVSYVGAPDRCPLCHTALLPQPVGYGYKAATPPRFQVAYQCPSAGCERLFIATYRQQVFPTDKGPSTYFVVESVEPQTPIREAFSSLIEQLSPQFVRIYNQALAAQAQGLSGLSM